MNNLLNSFLRINPTGLNLPQAFSQSPAPTLAPPVNALNVPQLPPAPSAFPTIPSDPLQNLIAMNFTRIEREIRRKFKERK